MVGLRLYLLDPPYVLFCGWDHQSMGPRIQPPSSHLPGFFSSRRFARVRQGFALRWVAHLRCVEVLGDALLRGLSEIKTLDEFRYAAC